MSKGLKSGGRNFQPGHKVGRRKIPKEVKDVRKLTASVFAETANRLLFGNRDDLNKVMNNPDTPVIDLLVAKVLDQAVTKGCVTSAAAILDRLIDRKPITIEGSATMPTVILNFDDSPVGQDCAG